MKTIRSFKLETKIVSTRPEAVGDLSKEGQWPLDKISKRIDEDIKIRTFCMFFGSAWFNRRQKFQYEKLPDVPNDGGSNE